VPQHSAAQRAIETACVARRGWGIATPSVAEFYSIVTHPSAHGRPSTPEEATAFLRTLEEAGGMALWSPGPAFGARLLQTAADLNVTGARIFDLQIGLCALEGGATELWTHDSRFIRIPGLQVRDPLS
jgi:predicted nucleic acid-binding protein